MSFDQSTNQLRSSSQEQYALHSYKPNHARSNAKQASPKKDQHDRNLSRLQNDNMSPNVLRNLERQLRNVELTTNKLVMDTQV